MCRWIVGFVGAGLLAISGCDALIGILEPQSVTVTLVNRAAFRVEVDLYYSEEDDIPESLLTTLGERLQFDLEPGEQVAFARDCEDLRAIIIDNAELQIIGGDEASTGVLRDGDEFDCGDRITFTLRSVLFTDLSIDTSVSVVPF